MRCHVILEIPSNTGDTNNTGACCKRCKSLTARDVKQYWRYQVIREIPIIRELAVRDVRVLLYEMSSNTGDTK